MRRRRDKHVPEVPVVVVYPLHILIRTPCTFQIVAFNVLLHLRGFTRSFMTLCRQTRRAGIHLQLKLFSFLIHLPSSQENQLPIVHPTASPLLLCFRQQNNQRVRLRRTDATLIFEKARSACRLFRLTGGQSRSSASTQRTVIIAGAFQR